MKVEAKSVALTRKEFGLKTEGFKISKPTNKLESNAEMQACFKKLKELVPTVPQHTRLNQVDLLQHVIDYILDLEITLDTHPTSSSIPHLVNAMSQATRTPLGENTVNTSHNQMSHLEKSPSECVQRPVSC